LGESDGSGEHINYHNVILDWKKVYDCADDFNEALLKTVGGFDQIDFQGYAQRKEWINVDLSSTRFADPVSSDFADDKYRVQLPIRKSNVPMDGYRFPWPDSFAARIDGGTISLKLDQLSFCIHDLSLLYRAMCNAGDLSEKEALHKKLFECDDTNPFDAGMIETLLNQAGFSNIKMLENSGEKVFCVTFQVTKQGKT